MEEHAPLVRKVDPKEGLVELGDLKVEIQRWSAERKIFSVQAKERVTLAIKLLNYPAWEVSIDGQRAGAESLAKNGQMLISMPQGEHGVDVRFHRTCDRTIGGVISAGSVIVLLIMTGALWRRQRSGKLTTAAAA